MGASGKPGEPADTIQSGRLSSGSRLAGLLSRVLPRRMAARLSALARSSSGWLDTRPGSRRPPRPGLTGARRVLWLAAGAVAAGAWVASAAAVAAVFAARRGYSSSTTVPPSHRPWAWLLLALAVLLTAAVLVTVAWPLARWYQRRRGRPDSFTWGTWLRAGLACLVLAGAAGFAVVSSLAPSAAQRSLAEIRVIDYQQTGEFSNASGGGTNSAAAFIGPPVSGRRISAIVTGPGVKVILVPATPTPGEVPRTGSIGFGLAPRGCYLDVDYFYRTAMPYPWFRVTAAQLRQVRSGQRSILLVWAVCGRDAARPAQ